MHVLDEETQPGTSKRKIIKPTAEDFLFSEPLNEGNMESTLSSNISLKKVIPAVKYIF